MTKSFFCFRIIHPWFKGFKVKGECMTDYKNVAVILSGCGYLDGAEIRESVLTLLSLDKLGAKVSVYAPDIKQMHVINHQTGEEVAGETRNVLVESARISRGNVINLSSLNPDNYDAIIVPGGYGVAKNLSDLAVAGAGATVNAEFRSVMSGFLKQQKPIGVICIAPAVFAAAVRDVSKVTVTIGDDADGLIESLGAAHEECTTDAIVVDASNKIVSTPAYMCDDPIHKIAEGIDKLVHKVLGMA